MTDRMQTVRREEVVDSTNRVLEEMAREGAPAGQVVIADAQTGGRGRRGRSFYSPGGKGLYLSYLLRPETAPVETVSLTAWTGVAVARAIQSVTGEIPGIKWVNDLMMKDRKVCGILTEMTAGSKAGHVDSVIIGIGINVNQGPEEFPEELRGVAGSLAMVTGHPVNRESLAEAVIREMDRLQADWPKEKEAYLQAYRDYDLTAGSQVTVLAAEGARAARALSINKDFSLEVMYKDGTREVLSSGEVSLRL